MISQALGHWAFVFIPSQRNLPLDARYVRRTAYVYNSPSDASKAQWSPNPRQGLVILPFEEDSILIIDNFTSFLLYSMYSLGIAIC